MSALPGFVSPSSTANRAAFDVTVVIPLFNKEAFIRRTLESVLGQTLVPRDIIIVDDSSTDGSVSKITDLMSEHVRIVQQPNAGPGPARNRGIAEAATEWVALIDGDDLWRADHLETLAAVSDAHPEADVLATSYRRVLPTDLIPSSNQDLTAISARAFDLFVACSPSPVWSSSVALRRSIIALRGGFDSFWPGEDVEFWTRLALDHHFAVTDRCTAFYVQNTGGLMDQCDDAPIPDYQLGPLYRILNDAIVDPRYADRRAVILAYRNAQIVTNIRQMLFRGKIGVARHFLSELDRFGQGDAGMLRILARLPAPILKAGLKARAVLRRR